MLTSNQKEVLFNEISQYIKKYKVNSLLDVGAGDGYLAKKISGLVMHYSAIEKDAGNVTRLKELGLGVIEADFPQGNLPKEQFDMVLVSHSIPEDIALYKLFFETVWKLLREGGILLVITFKGGAGSLMEFIQEWQNQKHSEKIDAKLYETLIDTLNILGKVEIHRSVSKFESENLDELVNLVLQSMKPIESEKEDCRLFLAEKIKRNFFSNGKYFFPLEHLVISVVKGS